MQSQKRGGIIVAWALLGLLALSGCNQKGQDGTGAKPAAINGAEAAAAVAPSGVAALTPGTGASKPAVPSDPLHPLVSIETSLGNIIVELDPANAELTVSNFLSNYVDSGFYGQTIFHQVFKGYVILGGSFGPDGKEKSAKYSVRNEANNGKKNVRGTIAMARQPDVRDSARAQFFINVADNPQLDHKDPSSPATFGYCVFGRVTQGMDVVDKIASVPVRDTGTFESTPVEPVIIKSIRRMP